MRAYRLRRDGLPRHRLPLPAKAHQARKHRENSPDVSDDQDCDIASATVRPIPLTEARGIIEKHEYLGTMPAVARFAYGIFFGERIGGVAVFGDEYAENRGVWDRYGFTGRIIALLRGACLPWAHRHSASKLIRRAMALLPERFKVVTATCCATAGEVGTVYQAGRRWPP
jgi:hypothetical protein